MNITKERAKEILLKYKKDNALFNWCEEYKQFVQDNVLYNMNSEVEYILIYDVLKVKPLFEKDIKYFEKFHKDWLKTENYLKYSNEDNYYKAIGLI